MFRGLLEPVSELLASGSQAAVACGCRILTGSASAASGEACPAKVFPMLSRICLAGAEISAKPAGMALGTLAEGQGKINEAGAPPPSLPFSSTSALRDALHGTRWLTPSHRVPWHLQAASVVNKMMSALRTGGALKQLGVLRALSGISRVAPREFSPPPCPPCGSDYLPRSISGLPLRQNEARGLALVYRRARGPHPVACLAMVQTMPLSSR